MAKCVAEIVPALEDFGIASEFVWHLVEPDESAKDPDWLQIVCGGGIAHHGGVVRAVRPTCPECLRLEARGTSGK